MCQAERRGASDKVSLAEAIWISWVLLLELFGVFFFVVLALFQKLTVLCALLISGALCKMIKSLLVWLVYV